MKSSDLPLRLRQWGYSEELFPEVSSLDGVPQSPEYHAEGDALTHTLLAVEAVNPDADERVFWAVLLHDIGKASTTKCVDGRWISPNHAYHGAQLVQQIMNRVGLSHLGDDIAWLVKHHHFALDWGASAQEGLTGQQKRFCASPLFTLLVDVCRADAAASLGSSRKGQMLENIMNQWEGKSK